MTEYGPSDEAILQRLDHQPELLEVLYRRWARRWTGLVLTAGVAMSDVEDVLQVILVEVWQHARRFDPGRGSAEAWLLQIARFRTIDYLRRQKPPFRELPVDVADGLTMLPDESPAWLGDVLDMLAPKERQAIQLLYHYGFTQKEIARMLQVPHGTVKSWIARGLKKLRQTLSGEGR